MNIPFKTLISPIAIAGCIFFFCITGYFLMPILVIFFSSFAPLNANFWHVYHNVLPTYGKNTLILVSGVCCLTALIGTSLAWCVSFYRFPGQRSLKIILLLPLAFPSYVIAFIYTYFLEYAGPVQTTLRQWGGWSKGDYWFPPIHSLGGAILVLSLAFYPYVYIIVYQYLQNSSCLISVARTLGLSEKKVFWQCGIKFTRPAIIAGVSLVGMETLSEFGAVQHFAVDTFTTGIYRSWFFMRDYHVAAKLSSLLLLCILCVVFIEKYVRKRINYTNNMPSNPIQLTNMGYRKKWIIAFFGWSIVFLGFVLPLFQLIKWWVTSESLLTIRFFSLVQQTLLLACVASIITITIALFYSYMMRWHKKTIGYVRLATSGYAVPGSVIAIGILMSYSWIDHTIDYFAKRYFGISTGLLLSGTLVAIIGAYSFRFITIALMHSESGFSRIAPEIEWSGRLLGEKPLGLLRKIHIPLVAPSLWTGFLLVGIECFKELPATLILRPFHLETLATYSFVLASDERMRDASLPLLCLVVVGVIPVIILAKTIGLWKK